MRQETRWRTWDEVDCKDDLEVYAARLSDAGIEVESGSRELADRRFVTGLITFKDPGGNRIEIIWKPMIASDPFKPGRPIQGFKTGPFGMGHAVLNVTDAIGDLYKL